jgi:hypothetical protein
LLEVGEGTDVVVDDGCFGAGAKVLNPRLAPGPVSAEGSGSLKGSIRLTAAYALSDSLG